MRTTEWGIFVEAGHTVRHYFCTGCSMFSGQMLTRHVTDGDNNSHREYKVLCRKCNKTGPLHWSKSLAEHSWKAINPDGKYDYISKSVEECLRKESVDVEKRQP